MDDAMAEGHEPHEKHLQLGVDLTDVDEDPEFLDPDSDEAEAAWADATTVEQFKADIDELDAHARARGVR